MAEAVFPREKVEKLTLDEPSARLAAFHAIFARLSEHFLVSYGPRHARDRDRQHKQPDELLAKMHLSSFARARPKFTSNAGLLACASAGAQQRPESGGGPAVTGSVVAAWGAREIA